MSEVCLLMTQASRYRRARRTNSTSAFPFTIPTKTEPPESFGSDVSQAVSAAVLNLAGGKGRLDVGVQNLVKITPFGVGSDTNTFKLRVWGWHLVQDDAPTSPTSVTDSELWVPELLGEFTCTMTAIVGVAGAVVDNTNRFCDTITAGGTLDTKNYTIDLPATDQIAHIVVDMKGAKKLQIDFDLNSSATSANCLLQMY